MRVCVSLLVVVVVVFATVQAIVNAGGPIEQLQKCCTPITCDYMKKKISELMMIKFNLINNILASC